MSLLYSYLKKWLVTFLSKQNFHKTERTVRTVRTRPMMMSDLCRNNAKYHEIRITRSGRKHENGIQWGTIIVPERQDDGKGSVHVMPNQSIRSKR